MEEKVMLKLNKKTVAKFMVGFVGACMAAVTAFPSSGLLPGTLIEAQAATNSEALNWCASKVGKTVGSGQCVALVQAYYNYLGVPAASGNGCNYATNALPSSWTRTKGGVPQPGDILVYKGGQFGHVAIYAGEKTSYHQNMSGQYVEKKTNWAYDTSWYSQKEGGWKYYWGCIHPNFTGTGNTASSNASATQSPRLCVDYIRCVGENKIQVSLWAYDPDRPGESCTIHAYIGNEAGGSGAEGYNLGATSGASDDVNKAYGITGSHRMEATFTVSKSGYQPFYIYAIDCNGDANAVASVGTVYVFGQFDRFLFNAKYYADTYPDVKQAYGYDEDALFLHWVCWGVDEGRSCSPALDLKYYLSKNADLKKEFGTNYRKLYYHFATEGYKEFRASSKYYDANYYKSHNSDLKGMGSQELLKHYINYGMYEKQRYANTIKYRSQNIEDLAFDYWFYANYYADVRNAYGYDPEKLEAHWRKWGIREGRAGSPILDLHYYLAQNSDLKAAYGNDYQKAYQHFITSGYKEGRASSKYYNGSYYKRKYSDLSGMDYASLLAHYVYNGIYEQRYANTVLYTP